MGSSGEFFAPSFTQKPKLRQEDDGNKLIFECKLLANPKPDIEWFRGDEAVEVSKRVEVVIKPGAKNLFDVQLIVDDVEEEDAGLYKVKARNKYGEVAASINLNFSREYYLFLSRSLVGRFRARIYCRRTVRCKKMIVSVRLG